MAVIAAGLWISGNAHADAPKLKEGKGFGIVILEVDGIEPQQRMWAMDDMVLYISWFDKVANRPYIESNQITSTDSIFQLASTASGHSYLIAKTYAGRSLLYQFTAQAQWRMCLNKGTISFYVAEDRYTYLGRYAPAQTRTQIEQAVMTHRMQSSVYRSASIPVLPDGHLAGFTAPAGTSEEKDRIEADMAEIFGAPHDIDVVQSTPIEFALTDYIHKDGHIEKMCAQWSSKKNRPEGFNGFKE